MSGTRRATHAGSWYSSDGKKLEAELARNLDGVKPLPDLDFTPPVQNAKAIIAPHAGFSYSGPAAAWAYSAIPVDKIKRIILLGPSHHAYISGVGLSPFASYETPLGNLPLCRQSIDELQATGAFQRVKPDVDEEEHSLEMHAPYIRHIFKGREDLKLVPLIVGHPSKQNAEEIHAALKKYWEDPETFFIISTDFCHWGSRFNHTPYYPKAPSPPNPVPPVRGSDQPGSGDSPALVKHFTKADPDTPIWQSIQYMDHEGMELLRRPAEAGAIDKWEGYLARTKNTICGRNPLTLLLGLIQHVHGHEASSKPEITFVRYEQSSKCMTGEDSSVSYVSGVVRLP